MKKIIAIFVILFIIFNSFGYVMLFYAIQKDIKRNIFRQIASGTKYENLECLRVSKKDFSANNSPIVMVEENEFEFNGGMYDIVKKEETKDSIIFYCINDEDEARLIKNFRILINEIVKNKNSSPTAKTLNILLNIIGVTADPFNLRTYITKHLLEFFYLINYRCYKPEVLTPPPRVISKL